MKTSIVILTVLVLATEAYAIPLSVNYEGKIKVNGLPFTGSGAFKFALVDDPDSPSESYWSNDGSSASGSEPSAEVSIPVIHGLYHVILGETDGMDPIPGSVFSNDILYLRIWFDDGTNGFQRLTPDQPLTSVGFAFRAADADTVDGFEGADLEESSEIDGDIAVHCAIADAHHAKTTSFTELTDAATDAQIPNDITVDYAGSAGDADTVDGMNYDASWVTSLSNIQTVTSNDFHNIGGTDAVDDADANATNELQNLQEVLTAGNDAGNTDIGNIGSLIINGNVGIGTTSPTSALHVVGLPEYADNDAAFAAGLTVGAFYRTRDLLKVVHNGALISTDNIVSAMRYVMSGTFTQGSPGTEPCRDGDETEFTHTLTRNLAVMETEVTRQMWSDLLAVQPSLPADPSDTSISPTLAHPVQQSTWYEAVLFANLLSIQNGYTPCYYRDSGFTDVVDSGDYINNDHYCDFDADGYRLATEGEWEYFSRGGTTTPFSCTEPSYTIWNCGLPYCVSGEFPVLEQHAVYCANYPGTTGVAGSKLGNPWNLKDVHGNVSDWCWDRYGTYPAGPETDYEGAGSGSYRVVRGGSWNSDALDCRSAQRANVPPEIRNSPIGFRLVRSTN